MKRVLNKRKRKSALILCLGGAMSVIIGTATVFLGTYSIQTMLANTSSETTIYLSGFAIMLLGIGIVLLGTITILFGRITNNTKSAYRTMQKESHPQNKVTTAEFKNIRLNKKAA